MYKKNFALENSNQKKIGKFFLGRVETLIITKFQNFLGPTIKNFGRVETLNIIWTCNEGENYYE